MSENKVVFHSDGITIRTRKSDNAILVTFEVGEYEAENVAQLMQYLVETFFKITVEVEDA